MTPPIVEISVVVATRDRAERLAAMLEGLRAQTVPCERFEVIVIVDGARDTTEEVLERQRQAGGINLRWSVHELSKGPAVARNRGWAQATTTRILFTDDDCVPTPEWIASMLAASRANPEAIVQGCTLPNPAEADGLGPFAKTVRITRATPHFETCNVLYPRELLERIGGFDEHYPAPAGEDSDLGWRAVDHGGTVVFAAEGLVYHAVHAQGPVLALRGALMATHGVRAYKHNPGLRDTLTQGVFYERSHPLLMQAALAAWLARRQPAAALLCAPYAMHLRSRCRDAYAPLYAAPYFVLYDGVQIVATIRGAIRHRMFVL